MAERLFGTPEEMVKGYCANCTASCWFHPADTDWLCESCRYNLLENPVCEDGLPDDYETCGTCGFDHEYDGCDPAMHAEIIQIHLEDERRAEKLAQREEKQMQPFITECEKTGAPICSFCQEDRDAAYRAAEFEHRIAGRVAEMTKPHIPRYWLEEGEYGHMVFVLNGLRQPGDSDDPRSWGLYDMQLAVADRVCRQLCFPAHMDRARTETEESGDAIWFGYLIGDDVWERIKDILISLLGDPGTAPRRLTQGSES